MAVDASVHWAIVRRMRQASALAAWAVMAMAIVVEIGWLADLPLLRTLLPGPKPMNPLTGICFLLAGSVLLRFARLPAESGGDRFDRAVALVVALLGAVVLADLLFDLGWQLDRLVFTDRLDTNRVAPNTALGFILIGAALLLVESPQPARGGRARSWRCLSAASRFWRCWAMPTAWPGCTEWARFFPWR